MHKALGPGLLETVYEIVLAHELSRRGLHVDRQVPVSIEYDGIRFDEGFRADMIVENKVILELKSVEKVTAQRIRSRSRPTFALQATNWDTSSILGKL